MERRGPDPRGAPVGGLEPGLWMEMGWRAGREIDVGRKNYSTAVTPHVHLYSFDTKSYRANEHRVA